uniref:Ovule protein n=1 Tax=Parascaris equorum TaxID=6256 RepID=A0A914RM68_PAREQ
MIRLSAENLTFFMSLAIQRINHFYSSCLTLTDPREIFFSELFHSSKSKKRNIPIYSQSRFRDRER